MNGRSIFSYTGRYDAGENTFIASFNPLHPQEKLMAAILSKPSKRLNLFAEFKTGQDNKSSLLVGYRTRFAEAMVTGSVSTSGKATANYRKFIEMLELNITGSVDFLKPSQPA